MGSAGTAIQPVYISLLSDISPHQSASQPSEPAVGFFDQIMTDAVASTHVDTPAASSQPVSSNAGTTPNTVQVQFDTTPGPLFGRPIAPSGASDIGQWAVLPDGSYFSASDVSATGLATLHAPPAGWQNTSTGQTLTSPAGIAGGAGEPATATSSIVNAPPAVSPSPATGAASAPNTLQVQFDTTPGPLFGRPIAPDGASEIGQWAVLPDGSYFSASDVSATGAATLTAPPTGWQNTPTGQTLTSPAGIAGGNVQDLVASLVDSVGSSLQAGNQIQQALGTLLTTGS
jgi:hypothetical protein